MFWQLWKAHVSDMRRRSDPTATWPMFNESFMGMQRSFRICCYFYWHHMRLASETALTSAPPCCAEVRHPSFCWCLVSISCLTRQHFIALETLGSTMLRECGHTSSYPSLCGLGRKRSNFKSLVHSSCARSALAAVYSPGLTVRYLCEIRWWSSFLAWATSFFWC